MVNIVEHLVQQGLLDRCRGEWTLRAGAEAIVLSLPEWLRQILMRRLTVNIHHHCCPKHHCFYDGWPGRGHIRANGHAGGKLWRQLSCTPCHTYGQATHGTPYLAQLRLAACLAPRASGCA